MIENVFAQKQHTVSAWDKLDKACEGRQNLGSNVPIEIFRSYTYGLIDYLTETQGPEECSRIMHEIGFRTGEMLVETRLDEKLSPSDFFTQLKSFLRDYRVGIFVIETYNEKGGTVSFTLREDLNYSGLTPSDNVSFSYDEGYFEGVLNTYSGKTYTVRHTDSWMDDGYVCRFEGKVNNG